MSTLEDYSVATVDETFPYRGVSKAAVLSLVFGVLSLSALAAGAMLIFPLAGMVWAVIAVLNIRRYPAELSGTRMAVAGGTLSGLLLVTSVSLQVHEYLTEVPEGYKRITFYQLNPEGSQEYVPESAKTLQGTKVFIKGYMHPGVKDAQDVREFVLVPDMKTCCFGGQPSLNDMIEVTLIGGESLQYGFRRLKLAGELQVDARPRNKQAAGGLQAGFYQLRADQVK